MRKNKRQKVLPIMIETNINVTKHTVDRYLLRRKIAGMSRNDAARHIVNEVKSRALIGIDGDFEHRLFKRDIYVVKREQDRLVVITMKLTKSAKKELFSRDFSLDTVDHTPLQDKRLYTDA